MSEWLYDPREVDRVRQRLAAINPAAAEAVDITVLVIDIGNRAVAGEPISADEKRFAIHQISKVMARSEAIQDLPELEQWLEGPQC
jgi:hypothetical protein